MPATFTINNFSTPNILEKGQLNADAAVSASPVTLNTINNNNIAANDYVVVGTLGSEGSELKQVTSVSGANSVVVPSITLPHLRFDELTKIYGSQITVQRAANVNGTQPADTSYAAFSGSLISIDIDQPSTLFTDPTGSSDYWYKFVYTNPTTGLSTSLADSSSARGQGYGNYASLADIRNEAGFNRSRNITDAIIDQKRQAAQTMINGALVGIYSLPFAVPINPLIADMTIRLAAGWLLLEQYGHFDTMNTNNGQKKVDSVFNKDKTGDLDKLQSGSMNLVDANGSSSRITDTAAGFNGHPNATTATDTTDNHGGDFMFRIGGVRGYQDRDY